MAMRAVALSLLGAAVRGQDLFLANDEKLSNDANEVEVIIIGAGWAGMAAADHLARTNKNVKFVVLEASNRTGGRTHALEFGNPEVGKFVYEQGSNWVCGWGATKVGKGNPKVLTNPVFDLAQKEGLKTVRIPGACDGNMSNYFTVFDSKGKNADANGAIRRKANAALACLNKAGGKAGNVESVRQGLQKCGWKPSTDAEWAMDWALASDESGALPGKQALSGFAPDPTYDWWGPDDWFVVDQHPRGYARVIDGMVRDTVPTGDPRLIMDAHVSKIDWGSKGVTVSTKDGRTFKGKHVISTVSLGVIRKHHQEIFSPPLPKKQAEALMNNHMPMCNLTHVLIQFPSVWWDNSVPAWVSANEGGKANKGLFTAWHNLNMDGMMPGSNTLLTFLGEPEASEFESMPQADLVVAVTERLRKQHPDIKIPDGVAAWLKNWGLDPLTYGAYAYAEPKVSWKGEWKKPLKKGKETIVRFAGEATCDNLDGYTHGALQSGKEAAAHYLHHAGKGPNPNNDPSLSLCGW